MRLVEFRKPPPLTLSISAMINDPAAAILQTYVGPYGRLTATGQYRLIKLLELMQRMTPDQVTMGLSEIREIKPTV